VIVRDATAADAAALAAIYGHHVLHGTGTFEEVPPSVAEMAGRLAAVRARGLPFLGAVEGGAIVGLAYAAPFRLRAAYRYTAEDSVYVAPGRVGQGIGRALLQAVIDRCAALGLRQLIAIVGDSANVASIGLHRSLGFEQKAVLPAVGFKHGAWVDIVLMQRPLGPGGAAPPEGVGLDLAEI
jgi:phosphinothricin acetyltransferase